MRLFVEFEAAASAVNNDCDCGGGGTVGGNGCH